MGFGNHARKVRDSRLPYPWRVSALRSCVQLYRPLGFNATLSYLQSKAGRFRSDEAALLGALNLIEASRAALRVELETYAARRREAKRQGRRSPRAEDANPNRQCRWYWYGAPQEAARHALWFWSRHRPPLSGGPVLEELGGCVQACLDAGGVFAEAERGLLGARLKGLERRLPTPELLRVVRHIEVAAGLR
ncbi:hypothetical protein HD597_009890 [Nonomuraea thailandensis]|uniref:Uncharacterized protein n=1 Tax=Nonomuraea thailandensis TaxID=1188745 RepID=A0A9X2GS10_9ACTN|nr:hypothetical protein [Nonomuraea thailandensis]MCP2362870.1 hypothetical protein [Nonomuraea thailandensis]